MQIEDLPTVNNGVFTLYVSGFESEVEISLFNFLGARVMSLNVIDKQMPVDLSPCLSGLYILKAQSMIK